MSHVFTACGRKKTEVRVQSLGVGSQVLECFSSMLINQVGVGKPGVLVHHDRTQEMAEVFKATEPV